MVSRNTGHEDLAAVADAAAARDGDTPAFGRSAAPRASAGFDADADSDSDSSRLLRPRRWRLNDVEGVDGWSETDPMEVARALMRLREDYVAGRGPCAAGAWEEKRHSASYPRAMLKTFSWKKMTEG